MELNIVLVEPQIPQNTGNIARTCAVTGARLHLIRPMGFTPDDKQLKRAGLDYWHYLDITYYDGLDDFFSKNDGAYFYFSTKAVNTYSDVSYPDKCFLFFGREATPVRMDENLLNDAEKQAVEAFSKKIDLTDSNLILQYGAAAQKNVASFSENALNSVRTKDLGEVGKSLSELVVELKGFGEEEEKKGLFGLFKKTGSKLEAMKAQYAKVETNVDKIAEVLEGHLLTASLVPLHVMEDAQKALVIMDILAEKGSRMAVSDVGVGIQFARTALLGGVMNVYINTKSMKNRQKAEELNGRAGELTAKGTELADRVYGQVLEGLKN